MNKKMKVGLGALLLTVVMSALPASGLAQQGTDPSQTIIPSLELDQSEIRDAMRALFKGMDLSFTISPDVQGSVTLQMRGKPFETVLQAILRQVDATYRVEGSTYTILKRETRPIFGGPVTNGITQPSKTYGTIQIKHADPQIIFLLLQGQTVFGALGTLVGLPGEITARGGGFGTGSGGGGGFNGGSSSGSSSFGSPGGSRGAAGNGPGTTTG